jgi:DnaJ like chaperone protein
MSVWGKIIGGVAGFALGGPLGAIMGAVAGHAVDRLRESETAPEVDELEDTRQVAFTIAVIVLGAKLAKADGVVTRDEINAFKQIFRVPPEEMKNIGRLFNEARQDAEGFEPYAEQIARMFRKNPAVLEELLSALFLIAKANGIYHPAQKAYLRRVATIFSFDGKTFRRIESVHFGTDKADPYELLGVPRGTTDTALKAAYRKLVRENHPDALMAQGVPKEFVELANEKLAAINAAYDRIRKERGLS